MVTRYLGLGREDSGYGEQSSLSPVFLDLVECNVQGDNNDVDSARGLTSRQEARTATTTYRINGSLIVPVTTHFPLILSGLLGPVESSEIGTSGFYRHTITEGFDLPSFTLFVGKDHFEKIDLGCMFDELTLESRDNFLEATVGVSGSHDEKQSLRDLQESEFDDEVFTVLGGSLERDGSDITPDVTSFNLSIENQTDIDKKTPFDKRWPDKIPRPDRLQVSLDFSIKFRNSNELLRFWGDDAATQPQDVKTREELVLSFVPRSDEKEFAITLPENIMVSHSAPIDARREIEQQVTYRGLFDRDSFKGLKFEFVNDHDGSMY